MVDNCKECIQAKLVKELDKRVTSLEKISNEIGKDLSDVKTNVAVNEEQTKMVFKILNEIKDSINTIAIKIDTLEKRPAQNWQELIKTIITVTATIAVTYFITKK